MIPLYRWIEVAVYSLLNFLPFLLLALYPFRHNYRFSKPVTAVLITVITVIQIGLGIWAAFFANGHAGLVSAASTIIYAGFYFLAVEDGVGKILFTLLMISNTANFTVLASKCLEGQLFGDLARQPYRWSFSLCMLLVELLIVTPLFFYVKKTFTPAIGKRIDNFMWKFMWLIPATFYLVWYYALYGDVTETSLEIALRPTNILILFLINLGAFFIHYLVVQLVNVYAMNAELSEKNHQLAMQSLQYGSLNEKIEETKKARHDLRHHMTVMTGFLDNDDTAGLRQYLLTYLKTLPDYSTTVFCKHPIFNMLIHYFAQLAKESGIDFTVSMNIPLKIPVADSDLAVLFGNLLENAVQACAAQNHPDRRIVMHGGIDGDSLVVTLDNTFDGSLKHNHDGTLLSTKPGGTGLGIESARAIAARYGGIIKVEQADGLFMASVMLELPEEKA